MPLVSCHIPGSAGDNCHNYKILYPHVLIWQILGLIHNVQKGITGANFYTDSWPEYSALVCEILYPNLRDVSSQLQSQHFVCQYHPWRLLQHLGSFMIIFRQNFHGVISPTKMHECASLVFVNQPENSCSCTKSALYSFFMCENSTTGSAFTSYSQAKLDKPLQHSLLSHGGVDLNWWTQYWGKNTLIWAVVIQEGSLLCYASCANKLCNVLVQGELLTKGKPRTIQGMIFTILFCVAMCVEAGQLWSSPKKIQTKHAPIYWWAISLHWIPCIYFSGQVQ